ncbi:MAG: hypothetical protein GF332_04365 [Candidatus Moranbacteria bacterium]|nr:hypothetical protein [Candidatus Moranbacteria bacterium]
MFAMQKRLTNQSPKLFKYLFFSTLTGPFVLDQIFKFLVRKKILGLNTVCNSGIAFGLQFNHELNRWLIIGSNIMVLAMLVYFISQPKNFLVKKRFNFYFVLIIISGALSNLLDRLLFGCVLDYLDPKIWPVFNLADAFITAAAILLIFFNAFSKSQSKKQ